MPGVAFYLGRGQGMCSSEACEGVGVGPARLMQGRSGELPGEWAWQSQPPTPAASPKNYAFLQSPADCGVLGMSQPVLVSPTRGRDRKPGSGGPGSGLAGLSERSGARFSAVSGAVLLCCSSRSSLSLEDRQRFGLDGQALSHAPRSAFGRKAFAVEVRSCLLRRG